LLVQKIESNRAVWLLYRWFFHLQVNTLSQKLEIYKLYLCIQMVFSYRWFSRMFDKSYLEPSFSCFFRPFQWRLSLNVTVTVDHGFLL
ncbi:hypothetical protein Ccrd_001481, partial [Cynara cardunculus var. scolymus]